MENKIRIVGNYTFTEEQQKIALAIKADIERRNTQARSRAKGASA